MIVMERLISSISMHPRSPWWLKLIRTLVGGDYVRLSSVMISIMVMITAVELDTYCRPSHSAGSDLLIAVLDRLVACGVGAAIDDS